MTRWASSNNATAAAQTAVAMVTLCELDFSDQTLYLNDSLATLITGGHTYFGVGDYAGLDLVEESTETIAKTITLSLTGVPGNLLTEAMTQNYQGRQVVISIGIVNVNTLAFIDTPEIIWEGRMDYMTVEIGQGSTSIQLRCENRLNREPLVSRMTDVDQQLAFPGDTFFDLVWMIPLASAGWGATTIQYPANVPPSGRGVTGGGPDPRRGPIKP
ncbi:MAG TPA: hypothetical protein VK803_08020 [Steroidobacteraceae bacterium]|nr:hypothetical protein [Steroidobacteraceae bacterium]